MIDDIEDTMKYRRSIKKRGQYGTDWYKYRDGHPPEDDDKDYEWSGTQWNVIYKEDY